MRRYPDELYHFGIKGMKWGIRRFQNRDGTRTKAGLRREKVGRASWKRRDATNISDEELRKRIARLQTERNYKQLMESDAHRTARDITRNVVSSTAGKVVGTVAAGAGLYYLKQLADKHGKGEVFEKIYEYGKGGGKKKDKR